MGSKLSRLASHQNAQHVIEINVQPGPSSSRSANEADEDEDELETSSASSCSSNESLGPATGIKRKFSIVSILSTETEHGDSNHRINLIPGAAVSLTDLSKLDPKKEKERLETESERLFREELEHRDREKQQERAKTARLKRRSELYGGSNGNGVKSAESVLRLIGTGGNGVPPIGSASSTLQDFITSLPPPPPPMTLNPLKETSALQRRPNQGVQPGTPMPPGSHKGINRVMEAEMEVVSRSAQYVINLNKKTGHFSGKKLSPLVSTGEMKNKAFLPTTSTGATNNTPLPWRFAEPPQDLIKVNHSRSPPPPAAQTPMPTTPHHHTLPLCSSKNKSGLLLEGNLTMNKIEQFLETRDHIDKTEFDMVVRNLVEQDTPPENTRRVRKSDSTTKETPVEPGARTQQQVALPDFSSPGYQGNRRLTNNNDNVFVSAPYHPQQSKYYGKNKFFEPAAYVHLPNVTQPASSSRKDGGGDTAKEYKDYGYAKCSKYFDGSEMSLKSERSQKSQKDTVSPPYGKSNEMINAESLIKSFNCNKSISTTNPSTVGLPPPNLGSIRGLPPVSKVPLVTRTILGESRSNQRSAHRRSRLNARTPMETTDSLTDPSRNNSGEERTTDACKHDGDKTNCRRCSRPPSRGGRVLMEWLHSKRRFSY